MLSQVQPNGTKRVVAYGSRSLNDHERNYCTTRLEILALVMWTISAIILPAANF